MDKSDSDNGLPTPSDIDRIRPEDARKVWERPELLILQTKEAQHNQGPLADEDQANGRTS